MPASFGKQCISVNAFAHIALKRVCCTHRMSRADGGEAMYEVDMFNRYGISVNAFTRSVKGFMNSRPPRLHYRVLHRLLHAENPRGNFSVRTESQLKDYCGSLDRAFALGPLAVKGPIRLSFALALFFRLTGTLFRERFCN